MRHFLKKATGPYYGPRGGKWADAARTIPWSDRDTPRMKGEADAEVDVKPHAALGMGSGFKLKVERVDGDTAYVSFDGGSTTPVPARSVHFIASDLQGEVHGKPSTHANINAVLSGEAKFLGKGDDGLAFKTHGRVVKVSTTVPYQPSNPFHKTPERAVQVAREQHQTLNAMRAAGVPGLLAETFVEHDGRGYTIRPFVVMPKKLTAEQVGKVHDSIEAMHKHGYVLGDEIQVGIHKGEPVLFDVGKAEKSTAEHHRERDEDRVRELYEQHGHEYKPRGASLQKKWDAKVKFYRVLKPKTPEQKEKARKELTSLAEALSKDAPDDLEREIIQEDLAQALGSFEKSMLIKAGPYYGPLGGKWADPAHTIPWKGTHKKVLFHSAPAHAMESIQEHGLTPRQGAGLFSHGGYAEHSQGKVFLSDNFDAARNWHSKVGDMLEHGHDDPEMHDAVMLRVKHRKTAVDEVGDKDVSGSRYTTKAIPPEDLEYYDKKHGWQSVRHWEPKRHKVPDESRAHHSGTEAHRIAEKRKVLAAGEEQRRKAAEAEREKYIAEHRAFVAEWQAKPEHEREAKAKELVSKRSPIPGMTQLNAQWQEALGVNKQGEIERDESKRVKLYKALKLHRRREFQGMQISVENQAGSYRHWRSQDGKEGRTKQLFDYGYIRRTKGTDGDHVDVYVGPNKNAPFVYVVTTMHPPEFLTIDEQKCMLGFDSLHDAREAFHAHFDDRRFLGEIRTVPLADFRAFVLDPENHGQLVKGYVLEKTRAVAPPLPDVRQIHGVTPVQTKAEADATEKRRKAAAKKNKGRYGFHGKPPLPTKRFRLRDWPHAGRPTTR